MLKTWYLQNFKSIVDSGELKLAPVTILAGRNSSGKSSLLQSILMIAQTLGNRLPDRALLPNGPIVQLGTFEDILSEQTDLRTVTVGFTLEMEKDWNPIIRRRRAVDLESQTDIESVKITSQFRSASSNRTSQSAIEASKVNVESVSLEISPSEQSSYLYTPPLPLSQETGSEEFLPDESSIEELSSFTLSVKRLSPVEFDEFIKGVLPKYLSFVPYATNATNYLGVFTAKDQPSKSQVPKPSLIGFFHFLPTRFIGKFSVEELRKQGLKYSQAGTLEELEDNIHLEYIDEALAQTNRFFTSKIRYLGPLRADPQVLQRFALSGELDDIGTKGEYAAISYYNNQNEILQWYNPYMAIKEESTLNVALTTWIRYLGLADEIKTQEAGLMGVSWQVVNRKGRKALPLSAVGAGVSQVLPILVMGLLAPSDTLLIIEEPELGLHSSVQARLGDFFMGLAKCGKQCLIETHSENVVSQLRLHIVEAGGQEKADCLIYFVDQDEQGAAKFDLVEISPKGNILNWPTGFFDETMLQEDRITAKVLKKRAKKANNG